MEFFDTHAHLADEQLSGDLVGVLSRARAAGVTGILTVGTTLASSRAGLEIAKSQPGVLAAAGLHPTNLLEIAEGDWDEVVRLAAEPQVVALGETGLDNYWKEVPLPLQQEYFDRHLQLSQATKLPVVIHQRESSAEILVMLRVARKRGPLTGIMHSFTGDAVVALECLELGLHLSFAGMVTFKNAADIREVAKLVPAERLLIETDSPYLTPHPHRGKRPNEPTLVVHTAACLAEARGVALAELARQTTANARALFTR